MIWHVYTLQYDRHMLKKTLESLTESCNVQPTAGIVLLNGFLAIVWTPQACLVHGELWVPKFSCWFTPMASFWSGSSLVNEELLGQCYSTYASEVARSNVIACFFLKEWVFSQNQECDMTDFSRRLVSIYGLKDLILIPAGYTPCFIWTLC